MLITFLTIGIVTGVVLCGALTFRDRCQLFELAIIHQRDDVKYDLSWEWSAFKSRSGYSKDDGPIRNMWDSLVSGLGPATQIDVLKATMPGLYNYSYDDIYAWVLEAKKTQATDIENLATLHNDYVKYLNESWFRFANCYYGFPKI